MHDYFLFSMKAHLDIYLESLCSMLLVHEPMTWMSHEAAFEWKSIVGENGRKNVYCLFWLMRGRDIRKIDQLCNLLLRPPLHILCCYLGCYLAWVNSECWVLRRRDVSVTNGLVQNSHEKSRKKRWRGSTVSQVIYLPFSYSSKNFQHTVNFLTIHNP